MLFSLNHIPLQPLPQSLGKKLTYFSFPAKSNSIPLSFLSSQMPGNVDLSVLMMCKSSGVYMQLESVHVGLVESTTRRYTHSCICQSFPIQNTISHFLRWAVLLTFFYEDNCHILHFIQIHSLDPGNTCFFWGEATCPTCSTFQILLLTEDVFLILDL